MSSTGRATSTLRDFLSQSVPALLAIRAASPCFSRRLGEPGGDAYVGTSLAWSVLMILSAAWARIGLASAALVAVVSCSGAPPGTDGADGSGGADTDGGSGGAETDGGTGGAQQASGGQGSGGTNDGGNTGTGGSGDLGPNECTDAQTCGSAATCYAPGETRAAICGAPQWCGECSCPAMLPVPEGNGTACDEATACPTVSDTVLRAASVCAPDTNLCTECLTHADCSENLPHCGIDESSGVRMCFQCSDDADCGGDTPHCFKLQSPFPSELGYCRQCQTTAGCAAGVCDINGTCSPGCQNDAQCGPNRVCGAEQRCVPKPCETDGECSSQSTCSDQTCRAVSCTSDAACPGGYCVKGSCYETPGGCYFDTAG